MNKVLNELEVHRFNLDVAFKVDGLEWCSISKEKLFVLKRPFEVEVQLLNVGGISPLVEMVSCWAVFLNFLGCGQGGLAEIFHELFMNWIVNI